ncbi:hypothetical protein [Streptomyces sp. NPDC018711]|uniref:hypothetical protein n=1 Tax=Streptomyces sp. NPDC018711 TaxID=3365052 RepID=UPI00379CD5DE
MTTQTTGDADFAIFRELIAEAMAATGGFGHREHVHLTWLAVRRVGMPDALALVGEGIRRTATAAGAPQKFHTTMTRAWVELVAGCVRESGRQDFAAFAAHHPELLDKGLLALFYRPATLASDEARAAWVEPDLAPLALRTDPVRDAD